MQSLADFAKLIKDTRNAVVHMTSDNRDDLDRAFSWVNKLSLMISFGFAVIEAHQLGLPLDRAHEFLLNNRALRHGLPNDLLESHGAWR